MKNSIKHTNKILSVLFAFGTDIHIYTGNPSVLGGISF